MLVPSTRERPGLLRALSALARIASESNSENQVNAPTWFPQDWRASFIAGQRNVIQHYRRVLATHHMPAAERQALLDRIARIDDEIRLLEQSDGEGPAYQIAAE